MNRHDVLASPTDVVEFDRPCAPCAAPVMPLNAEGEKLQYEERDIIDRAIDAQMDVLDAVMEAMIEPIQSAFDAAKRDGLTAAELIERLPELLSKVSTDKLHQGMTNAAFAARMVAVLGATVQGES